VSHAFTANKGRQRHLSLKCDLRSSPSINVQVKGDLAEFEFMMGTLLVHLHL